MNYPSNRYLLGQKKTLELVFCWARSVCAFDGASRTLPHIPCYQVTSDTICGEHFIRTNRASVLFPEEGGHSIHHFSLYLFFPFLFRLEEMATLKHLCCFIARLSPVASHQRTKAPLNALHCFMTRSRLQTCPRRLCPFSRRLILFSRPDAAGCKWLFVIKWLLRTTTGCETSARVCPSASSVQRNDALWLAVFPEQPREEALGRHGDKTPSWAAGRNQGSFFFLTFFCYRPQHSNLF